MKGLQQTFGKGFDQHLGVAANGDPDSRALQGKMLRLNVDAVTTTPGTAMCGEPRLGLEAAYAIPVGQPGSSGGPIAAACDDCTTMASGPASLRLVAAR